VVIHERPARRSVGQSGPAVAERGRDSGCAGSYVWPEARLCAKQRPGQVHVHVKCRVAKHERHVADPSYIQRKVRVRGEERRSGGAGLHHNTT
jgi:hypothetical protein